MNKYELLVFDWDGTLVDSVSTIVGNFQQAAKAMQLSAPSNQRVEECLGLGFTQIAQELFGDIDIKEFGKYYLDIHNSTWQNIKLFDGAHETLTNLVDSGYKLAVATSRRRNQLQDMLNNFQINNLFATTICADEAKAKPDPIMLQKILESLQVSPSKTLMVGDSVHDVEFAKNANVDILAVDYGAQKDIQTLYPDIRVISNISKLTAAVQ